MLSYLDFWHGGNSVNLKFAHFTMVLHFQIPHFSMSLEACACLADRYREVVPYVGTRGASSENAGCRERGVEAKTGGRLLLRFWCGLMCRSIKWSIKGQSIGAT